MMYAYVITGSEDGTFAVSSRKARAFRIAFKYMIRACEVNEVDTTDIILNDHIRENMFARFEHPLLHTVCTVQKFEIE